jgi:hypothetical protein
LAKVIKKVHPDGTSTEWHKDGTFECIQDMKEGREEKGSGAIIVYHLSLCEEREDDDDDDDQRAAVAATANETQALIR